jgi:hypothetical protein
MILFMFWVKGLFDYPTVMLERRNYFEALKKRLSGYSTRYCFASTALGWTACGGRDGTKTNCVQIRRLAGAYSGHI